MFVKMGSDSLGEASGLTVRMLEGGNGNFLFEKLSDLIGEVDDVIEFAGRGGNVVRDVEGAGESKTSVEVFDFTLGGKGDRLVGEEMGFILESAAMRRVVKTGMIPFLPGSQKISSPDYQPTCERKHIANKFRRILSTTGHFPRIRSCLH